MPGGKGCNESAGIGKVEQPRERRRRVEIRPGRRIACGSIAQVSATPFVCTIEASIWLG